MLARGETGAQPASLAGWTQNSVETGEPHQALRPAFDDQLSGEREGDAEVLSAPDEESAAMALGEQAEVADADEAIGQDVEQKAAEEFAGRVPQDFPGVVVCALLGAEEHFVALEADELLIRDRHPEGVADGVTQRRLETDKRGA